ncbi:MAG: FAD-dependent oxidoreductase [Bdellovibrionota bacterium]
MSNGRANRNFGRWLCGVGGSKGLKNADVEILIVDRQNHHLFQPLLYQVATGGLSPEDIAVPIRHVFRRQQNVKVLQAEIKGVDRKQKLVQTSAGQVPTTYSWSPRDRIQLLRKRSVEG